jgi:phage terminase large subunit-like protein
MVAALERFHTSVVTGQLSHDGDEDLSRHVKNAHKKETRSGLVIRKDRPHSPRKIDLAVCAVLAYEARGDVIQSGKVKKKAVFAGF